MELKLLSFDQMERMVKRNRDLAQKAQIVPLPSILSKAPFDQIPYKVDEYTSGWDGKKGVLFFSKEETNVMSILHEVSHYFLCPPERLKVNNFGLGWGDSSGLESSPRTIGMSEAEKEEEAVCDLTIALAKKLRVPMTGIMWEMDYANIRNFILNQPDQAKATAKESFALIKNRNIERFGFKVVYPG